MDSVSWFRGDTMLGWFSTCAAVLAIAAASSAPSAAGAAPPPILITSGLTIISTSPLPLATVNKLYSQALAAISGVEPYTWSVSAKALPPGIALDASSGLLSGRPTTAGTFHFVVRVTDSGGASDSKSFELTVVVPLAIGTTSLPAATVGEAYSQTLVAISGTSPYAWSLSGGSLPPGLALNAQTGAISGAPTAQGTYPFIAQVADATGTTATRSLSIAVGAALSIASGPALPAATLGIPYSQPLIAAGGTPPYSWSIASGALPAGVTLNSAGTLAGTPQAGGTFHFTVQVADSAQVSVTAGLSLDIAAQALPLVAVTNLPDTAPPLDQPSVGLALAAAYPVPLSGQLVLSFTPDAVVPADDPAIQFSTGGRTADFTIPANAVTATFSVSNLQIQTGSVAGTITITVKLQAGSIDVTPSPAPGSTVKIDRSAPVIRSLKLVTTTTGFEIWITGYAPSREITAATVQCTPAAGSNLLTTTFNLPMSGASQQWYQTSASTPYGSQFTIVQPFTVQGSSNPLRSVSVTLANTIGTSNAVLASF